MFSFLPDSQTLVNISIGSLNLSVRWYAILILTGALGTYIVSRSQAKKAKYIDLDFFDELFVYALWVGVIGARLWYCAFIGTSYYFKNPSAIIRIWDGGLAIQGGVVFGALFAYLYCKKYHYPFLKILDIILPNVLIGQGVGRWGNFINKECHGGIVDISYFDGILSFLRRGMFINGNYYEPLFFYESVLCILGWILLFFGLRKHQNKRGDLAYGYLMWYGVIRFFIEGRRTDSLVLGNMKMAQLTSIVFFIVGVLGYFGVFNKILSKQKPTILFDMDGTLIDTRESIWEAYKALFAKYSDVSKFTEEVKQAVIGPALRDMFPIYFPGIDYDTLYKDYHERQNEVRKVSNHPMEHVPEVLKQLHEEGYKIAIISTRLHKGIDELLDDFNLTEYVDYICGLDDVKKLKPSPEGIFKIVNEGKFNRECVLIGDSIMDMECGINYGAYTVAYISYETRGEALKEKANEAITDMSELLEILKQDISFTYDKK